MCQIGVFFKNVNDFKKVAQKWFDFFKMQIQSYTLIDSWRIQFKLLMLVKKMLRRKNVR